MDAIPEWIKILGGAAGVAALIWRLIDEFRAYLRVTVKAEAPKGGWASALTTVENGSNRAKQLSYAFLLIGPEAESPLDTARVLAEALNYRGLSLQYTNQLELLRAPLPIYAKGRALIPLPFYYSENVRICDEMLSYRTPIDASQLQGGIPYAVRFFLFGRGRLHRSTQDSFVNSKAQQGAAPAAMSLTLPSGG